MFLFQAKNYKDELDYIIKTRVEKLSEEKYLAIVKVGDNPASNMYVNIKQKVAEKVGIQTKLLEFPKKVKKVELIEALDGLSSDKKCGGILIQYPLPPTLDINEISQHIEPSKDVDFFTHKNLGKFYVESSADFAPPVIKSVAFILNTLKIDLKGARVLLIGQGFLVGKPLLNYFSQNLATVVSFNEYSDNLKKELLRADLIITATGEPGLIKGDSIKKGASIIDFGAGNKDNPTGDLDMDSKITHLNIVSPSPGGVGPINVRFVLFNFIEMVERVLKNK